MGRADHCCLCGEPRRPTQAPVESFGNNECIAIGEHRELKPARWEQSPQLVVNVRMWRNGGSAAGETHICDGCIIVGLEAAKRFVDGALASLARTALAQSSTPGCAAPRCLQPDDCAHAELCLHKLITRA